MLTPPERSALDVPVAPDAARPPPATTRILRLLVVNEEEGDREAVRRALAEADIAVDLSECADPVLGAVLARKQRWDCVLLALRFSNGLALDHFGDLLGLSVGQRAPVILLIDAGEERAAVQAMRRGVQDYVPRAGLDGDALNHALVTVMERAALQRQVDEQNNQLLRMSLYDNLTGLPNRALYFERLDQLIFQAERGGPGFAVLMMDLNLFKEVNDAMGHEAGDRVLRMVAERLQRAVRRSDTVSRLGGDEFAALLTATDTLEGATVVAEHIGQAMIDPLDIDGTPLQIGVSVGIALYPQDGTERPVLLRNADQAMYEAKRGSRGYAHYGEERKPQVRRAAQIAAGLVRAVEQEELVLHYQPQIDLASRQVVGVEALLRWQHPQLGMIPPGEFIPAAERSAVIRPLTLYTIDRAMAQTRLWRDAGICFSMSVNLTPRLLDDPELADSILESVHDYGLPTEALIVEITETGAFASRQSAARVLGDLARAGVRISIDDFGSGYTSLKYLRDFPFHEIKIDRMFVSAVNDNSRDAAIVSAILELADGLGVRAVAEGIETDAVSAHLLAMGCSHGQGYHFSRPVDSHALVKWLSDWNARHALVQQAPA